MSYFSVVGDWFSFTKICAACRTRRRLRFFSRRSTRFSRSIPSESQTEIDSSKSKQSKTPHSPKIANSQRAHLEFVLFDH
jgi:hypothetical protein